MSKFYAGLAVAVVVGLVGGSALWIMSNKASDAFAQCRAGAVGGGEIGGPFTLVDGDGRTVTDKDVLTKPSLVYFGYTFCPDVCPFDNARNAEAIDLLVDRGYDVQPVFISIDPERDTPEVVKDFAANLHPRMIGLTGSAEQVKAASLAYKTYFKKQEAEDEFYLVDHSTFTYLMLPGSGFAEFYKREATPEQMADSVACFVDAAKAAGQN
ncbi:MAG: SCO family protein [Rhodobacterales bacterium 65-51]|uniref:SCO family protein n=1 Tax=uncultured Gemmobacter sp. TaxID=1095917 RepID=UPI000962E84C|nr:SCO family protein [uncultured Gemmobacter sp.]OJY33037.1 MAG: SCO family protein [Rhodobacterales bacterium 65-51]